MASEDEKKDSTKRTYPPPPFDPFPTYQSPFPRQSEDTENPFIQFRRFADEQIHSLFSSLPQLFGYTNPDNFKKDIEEIMRKGQEIEEGWRKQIEQDMEEARQLFRRSIEEHDKVQTAPKPWWTKGEAANCPALNGTEVSSRAKNCPAMYDQNGAPKTELDAYESLDKGNKEAVTKSQHRGWMGYDGKRTGIFDRAQVDESDGPQPEEVNFTAPTRYRRSNTRNMDPFEDANDTIPWLVLNSYSPVYLCNPGQARMFKVHIQDNEGVPMQISRPRFVEVGSSDFAEKMAKQLPWADAFEDLVSLQQTGRMVDRNYSTYRTPATWIHDMVSRGSLGPKWGFDETGRLMKVAQRPKRIEDKPSADDIVKAVADRENEARQAFEQAVAEKNANDIKVKQDPVVESMEQPALNSNWSSSSAISSWSNFDSADEQSDSIVSTLTRTESRTLPNGSVETRRTLKRRFADGREEAEESVDIKPAASGYAAQTPTSFTIPDNSFNNQVQPATPVQNELKKQQKKGGWFWN